MDLENMISRVAKAMTAGNPSEEEALAILQEHRSEIIRAKQQEGLELFAKLKDFREHKGKFVQKGQHGGVVLTDYYFGLS